MLATLVLAAAVATANPCAGVKNPPLCHDLLDIYTRDQAARVKNVKPKDARKIDTANLRRVQAIINQFGWPGRSLVGERASGAAWSVIEHADIDTQKMYIDMMTQAAEAKEFSPTLVATAVDRIAIHDGKAQVYGTDKNAPIDDADHVNDRRAKIGLPPLQKEP